jgi:hypothetical protein
LQLDLVRDVLTEKSTTGKLAIDGVFFCFSLEIPVRDGLPGSAIPEGLYPVTAEWSLRFGRSMPHIQNIPARISILIHWLNYPDQTEGCVGIGYKRESDSIFESRQAFDDFWPRLLGGLARGNVLLHVSQMQPVELNLQGDA